MNSIVREQIQKWISEHETFKRLLVEVEKQAAIFDRGASVDYDLMLSVVYYMTEYPDKFHHPTEDVLFNHLATRDKKANAAIDQLHHEHRVIAESGMALRQQLDAVVNGVMASRAAVIRPLQRYVQFFRRHMKNEETIVFPIAREILSDSDWELAYLCPAKCPSPLFSKGVRERYRSLRKQIAADVYCTCSTT